MDAVRECAPLVGKAAACTALSLPRSSFYAAESRAASPREPIPRPTPARALSQAEREVVLATLHSERFVDQSPQEVWATLLDEESHLCSVRTMYRILEAEGETRERRQRQHVSYKKPELLATAPNQLWSWDITKLRGPAKWTYFYLYVIIDVFSRYVVGWLVATEESAELAGRLISETCLSQGIPRNQLTIHADRGSSMKSKHVAFLLADLGITKSHSRPHVSNDNPYSESAFKTLKYRPEFPGQFGSLQDARQFCVPFFGWYNTEHRHSGIALLTPKMVHFGHAPQVIEARHRTLLAAYQNHPDRFVRRPPKRAALPQAVWINKPPTAPSSESTVQ